MELRKKSLRTPAYWQLHTSALVGSRPSHPHSRSCTRTCPRVLTCPGAGAGTVSSAATTTPAATTRPTASVRIERAGKTSSPQVRAALRGITWRQTIPPVGALCEKGCPYCRVSRVSEISKPWFWELVLGKLLQPSLVAEKTPTSSS